jgi:hypothetical protein
VPSQALYHFSKDGIALVAATAKTVAECSTAAQFRCFLKRLRIGCQSVTASDTPILVEWGKFSAAVTTATTLAAAPCDHADGTTNSTWKHSTTTEGAGTASDAGILTWRFYPLLGEAVYEPQGEEWVVDKSAFWRLRLTAAQAQTIWFDILFGE